MRSRSAAVKSEETQAAAEATAAEAAAPEPPKDAAKAAAHPPASVEEFLGDGVPARRAEMPGEYRAIVTSVFTIESPEALYREVMESIRPVRASRVDRGTVIDLLDAAQDTAVRARQLLAHAKVTHDLFEVDAKATAGAMREQATARLEAEKAAGSRKKAITEADVEGTAAAMFPDAWRETARTASEAKQTVQTLEFLVDRAIDRARDLRAILNSLPG